MKGVAKDRAWQLKGIRQELARGLVDRQVYSNTNILSLRSKGAHQAPSASASQRADWEP